MDTKKYIHAALHTAAVICTSISIYVIVTYKNFTQYPQFVSVHAWIGIFVFAAYSANVRLFFPAHPVFLIRFFLYSRQVE